MLYAQLYTEEPSTSINSGPTITVISDSPDFGILSTDSTPQSIPPSTASAQGTEVRYCSLFLYIFTSLCSLRIILVGKNINQVWLCVYIYS